MLSSAARFHVLICPEMHAVLLRKLSQRQFFADRIKRNTRLKLS